jgi:hypothetical protein
VSWSVTSANTDFLLVRVRTEFSSEHCSSPFTVAQVDATALPPGLPSARAQTW